MFYHFSTVLMSSKIYRWLTTLLKVTPDGQRQRSINPWWYSVLLVAWYSSRVICARYGVLYDFEVVLVLYWSIEHMNRMSGKFCGVYVYDAVCCLHHLLCNVWAVCYQLIHLSSDDCENIYTSHYYHHQIGNMICYSLVRIRSWNNGIRVMFYVIVYIE